MSSQRANSRCMAAWIVASACSMPPRVSSEKTTPKPNVSSAALRSHTVISRRGSKRFASAAKYSPPGPPPTTAMRMRHPDLCARIGAYAGSVTTVTRTLFASEPPTVEVMAAMSPFRGSVPFTEDWKNFRVERVGGIATLTFDRPDKLNALTFEAYADLRDLLAELPHRCDAGDAPGRVARLHPDDR